MKLIIDIDEDTYKSVIADSTTYVLDEILVENAIKNGTPLEDIKAEIEESMKRDNSYTSWSNGKNYAFNKALEIIDKYIEGKGAYLDLNISAEDKDHIQKIVEVEWYKKAIEDIRTEIKRKKNSIPWRNTQYQDGQIEAFEDALEIINKHIGGE